MVPAFSVTLLRESLTRLLGDTRAPRCCVAFSGGVDSTALLHAFCQLREGFELTLWAVHVNHHLQQAADEWAAHCLKMAERLSVSLDILDVQVRPPRGESLEAAARTARYAAIAGHLVAGEHVITAHHREDQLETILLRLVRGAGVAGLGGMPEVVPLGAGRLLRPLLGVERSALVTYCQAAQLPWIDDSSNADLRFDRNFLRARVIPALRERWPAVADCVARSGSHLAEARTLLDERAHEDLALARDGDGLRVAVLRGLAPARVRNLLRFWIEAAGAPLPSSAVLDQVMTQMLGARRDATPLVVVGEREVRRYRDVLYLCEAPPPVPADALSWSWREQPELVLPAGLGRLRLRNAGDDEAALDLPAGPLTIAWQGSGLKLQVAPRGSRRTLRNLYQERGIVPWMRPLLPLVFAGDALVAVGDLWIDTRFRRPDGERGITLEWLDAPPVV
ncbi:MAG TPA: tRNA lysidine(34) synthetase TilS [Steroidobacteraceae bacterium]|nr:tRNA lysidine(34) synthetase TilS [Steroidobacteraceae bacterium]